MTDRPEILAIVPARGGSAGVPRKNLREVGGRTLLEHAIAAALRARTVTRVVVSTDDDEIAGRATAAGAEAPFVRPERLAGGDVPDLPVLTHALAELGAAGYRPKAVVWLRPTSPLRLPEDVDGAVSLLLETGADAVRSVCEEEHHPYWLCSIEGNRLVPFCSDVDPSRYLTRQSLPPVFRPNGAVDVVACRSIPAEGAAFEHGDVRAYLMPAERSLDVDSELDVVVADALLRERGSRL